MKSNSVRYLLTCARVKGVCRGKPLWIATGHCAASTIITSRPMATLNVRSLRSMIRIRTKRSRTTTLDIDEPNGELPALVVLKLRKLNGIRCRQAVIRPVRPRATFEVMIKDLLHPHGVVLPIRPLVQIVALAIVVEQINFFAQPAKSQIKLK